MIRKVLLTLICISCGGCLATMDAQTAKLAATYRIVKASDGKYALKCMIYNLGDKPALICTSSVTCRWELSPLNDRQVFSAPISGWFQFMPGPTLVTYSQINPVSPHIDIHDIEDPGWEAIKISRELSIFGEPVSVEGKRIAVHLSIPVRDCGPVKETVLEMDATPTKRYAATFSVKEKTR